MTMFKPCLEVRKLVVSKGGHTVFEATFRSGLNIIRGENSSGKSTIMDFLFYGLGGDLQSWREAALECDEVTVEALFNGLPATLRRDVKNSKSQPMRICPAPYDEAVRSATKGWTVHPYRRTGQRESFSQMLFRWLDLPEVPGEEASNITMHQLLRLMYSDQVTPIDRLFRAESFDSPLVRQTVGDLLCGAYNNELFEAQIRRRQADDELKGATAELRSLFSALGNVEHPLTAEWIAAERQNLSTQINSVQGEIESVERKIFNAEVSDGLSLKSQEEAYAEVRSLQERLAALQEERDELQLEIADSDAYIRSLLEKESALRDASFTAEFIKTVSFAYCPACFAPIEEQATEHACHLCKSPFDKERSKSRILLMLNEVGLQLKQSRALQDERVRRLQKYESELLAARSRWDAATQRYRHVNRLPSTELRVRLRDLNRRAGYLERQAENLNEKASLIDRVSALSLKKASLQAEISQLNDYIAAIERAQEIQLKKAYTRIADGVVALLKQDLARQDTFERAENVSFSFDRDRISVNGESFFSASSMVYLRNSFLVSFWKASLEDASFRFPRFLMMDTIEDKGMEPARSHNFQNSLATISAQAAPNHQLIFATSMISPSLEDTDYVVGRYFTHQNRTLSLRG